MVISALYYCIRFLSVLSNCSATFLIAIIKLLVILITPPSYACLLASPSLFHPMSSPCLAFQGFSLPVISLAVLKAQLYFLVSHIASPCYH